jgi:hypothetical protein
LGSDIAFLTSIKAAYEHGQLPDGPTNNTSAGWNFSVASMEQKRTCELITFDHLVAG